MTALFSATLFLGAALLFWVQPMIAKMLLPLLGGGPSVWNTCMVFFQAMLLGGYAYAHFVSVRLSIRWQVMMHFCLLSLAALALPLGISEKLVQSLTPEANPFWWLLGALLLVAGPSFFAIAGTGPLLQKWFSNTGHVLAKDPYFLYSASNLGSLISLLGYPVLLESHLRLREQSLLWTSGYFALALLILFCGASVWRFHQSHAGGGNNASRQAGQDTSARAMDRREIISGRQRLRWLAFAFVPSSLMLGVTSYLATDIASIPLLWIVPLSIYLLSFVLVFGRRRMLPMSWLNWLLPMGALGVAFQILTRGTHPIWLVISIHLLFLFLASMVCHGRLAVERPDAVHLTAFYFWISLGGAFGGIFNALAAPNLFSTVIEYPAAI
ncbi:MAG: spermidine synthase, partial [Verrucomicrobia bacterium]